MNSKTNIKQPTVDELLAPQGERDEMLKEKVELLPLDKLAAFENHPFRVAQVGGSYRRAGRYAGADSADDG